MAGEIPTKPRKILKEATNDEIVRRIDDMEERVSKDICDLEETVQSLKTYLIGDVNGGNGEKIGLGERVRIIEVWIKSRSWIEKTFLGVIVAEGAAFIILTVRVVLEHTPLIVK